MLGEEKRGEENVRICWADDERDGVSFALGASYK